MLLGIMNTGIDVWLAGVKLLTAMMLIMCVEVKRGLHSGEDGRVVTAKEVENILVDPVVWHASVHLDRLIRMLRVVAVVFKRFLILVSGDKTVHYQWW